MLNLFKNCIISSWTYKVITLTLKKRNNNNNNNNDDDDNLEVISIVFTRVSYKMEGNWVRGWGFTWLVVELKFSSLYNYCLLLVCFNWFCCS